MNGNVEWMGAQADEQDAARAAIIGAQKATSSKEAAPSGEPFSDEASLQKLPAHNFLSEFGEADLGQAPDDALDRNPDLWLYRRRTVELLRRFVRFSLETGRLPSIMGREFFRAKMTSYRAVTFEDRVIFVRDVETCLNRLAHSDQQLIARVILQEYSQEDAARILHCCRRTVQRRVPEVLDLLSEDFLRVGLLAALPS